MGSGRDARTPPNHDGGAARRPRPGRVAELRRWRAAQPVASGRPTWCPICRVRRDRRAECRPGSQPCPAALRRSAPSARPQLRPTRAGPLRTANGGRRCTRQVTRRPHDGRSAARCQRQRLLPGNAQRYDRSRPTGSQPTRSQRFCPPRASCPGSWSSSVCWPPRPTRAGRGQRHRSVRPPRVPPYKARQSSPIGTCCSPFTG